MPELIPVRTIILADLPEQTCNARDLHGFLCVGKVFAAWIIFKARQEAAPNAELCGVRSTSERAPG